MRLTRQRVARLVLAVVAGLVLALVIDVARSGGPAGWLARHRLPAPYAAIGERIQVGEGQFYLDCRGEGPPTVVLEAGAGTGASSWSLVLGGVAATTRTCAYDRAGLVQSDPRGRRSLADAARDLRALLAAAEEPGPYVVVGHSLGGAYGRVFAAQHRDVTAALVLVDSFDPDLQTDFIQPLLGDLAAEYEAQLDGLRATVEAWEDLDWATSERQLREGSLVGLPVAVLVAPRYEPRRDASWNEEARLRWIQAYESLAPGTLTHEYADGSGHMIPIDRPDRVIEVVNRVVEEVRRGGG